jgi:hypothetical protein
MRLVGKQDAGRPVSFGVLDNLMRGTPLIISVCPLIDAEIVVTKLVIDGSLGEGGEWK